MLSVVIMVLTAGFAIIKLHDMLIRKKPNVISNIEIDALGESEKFNLRANDFILAITLDNWRTGSKVDKRYLNFVAMYQGYVDGRPDSDIFFPLEPCTDDEFAGFYPRELSAQ